MFLHPKPACYEFPSFIRRITKSGEERDGLLIDGKVKSSTKSYKIGKARESRGMRRTGRTP